jgi:hypothetical protein
MNIKVTHFITASVLLASYPTQAAQVAFFDFNSNISSSLPGYTMTAINSLVPFTPNDYVTETVFGSPKTVLNVEAAHGLNLDVTALVNRTNYTIVMDVRSPTISGYNKLMSLDGGFSDAGVYFVSDGIAFYPLGSSSNTLTPNQWTRVALSYNGTDMNLFYGDLNNFTLASTGTADSYYTLADTLQFVVDDSSTGYNENSPLQISSLRLFDTSLSLQDIQNLSIPEPSAALLGSLGVFALLRRRRN